MDCQSGEWPGSCWAPVWPPRIRRTQRCVFPIKDYRWNRRALKVGTLCVFRLVPIARLSPQLQTQRSDVLSARAEGHDWFIKPYDSGVAGGGGGVPAAGGEGPPFSFLSSSSSAT